MIISMQGNWTVTVKSKSAAFTQQFVISGAVLGNGVHLGVVGTSVNVTGKQWSIAIRNNPGTGFQLSDTQIKFPKQVGSNYEFEIWSNDAGGDKDFNDLILTCSTPVNINDFIIYGNVSLYSGKCIFNPCRKGPFVIDTHHGLKEALKNPKLKEILEKLYPERIPHIPNPPELEPFKPIVIDLYNEGMQPKTELTYKRVVNTDIKSGAKNKKETINSTFSVDNFTLLNSSDQKAISIVNFESNKNIALAKSIEGLFKACNVKPATNVTLTFEEYDRSIAELAGGAYTGTGNRQLLGDTVTDMYGNYIFRFTFDMEFPDIADATDIAGGESMNVVAYPDVIVKVTGFSPYNVLYESAPYYNIPNLKRINLCLPKSSILATSVCFNGNLIGSLGNVFIGGNQNTGASFLPAVLRRYGNSNYLEENGIISVNSSLAGFNIECAPWGGLIDMKGCLYDSAKTAAQNTIKWYTIRIKREGTPDWVYVSQNYKHPKFSNRNLPNYIGDNVGPLYPNIGALINNAPAYVNIQREIFVDGVDWEFSNFDRYMQLNTGLYDLIAGVTTPGTFYVRVDCYDVAGNIVPNATDMIALFIHNLPLKFQLNSPSLTDPLIVSTVCGLYRLTNLQMNTPMQLSFMVYDEDGFVHEYALSMARCPAPMIALQVNQPASLPDTLSGAGTLSSGNASGNVHHDCDGYTGTLHEFSDAGLINVEFQPDALEGGWIKNGEYFTVISFTLTARKRVTNGYNSGVTPQYYTHTSIYMERLNP